MGRAELLENIVKSCQGGKKGGDVPAKDLQSRDKRQEQSASIRVMRSGMTKPVCWLSPGCPYLYSAHGHVQPSSVFELH